MTVKFQSKGRKVNQTDRMESQETDLPRYSHLIYNKGASAIQ